MEKKVFRMCTRCSEGFGLNHGGEALPPHRCETPKKGGANAHSTTHTRQHVVGQGVATTGCGEGGHGSGGR